MDKLTRELLDMLRATLDGQQRLLRIAVGRQEAMRTYDIERLNGLAEQERTELERAGDWERRRKDLVARFKAQFGPQFTPTASEIARRCEEPGKTQILMVAAEIKKTVELIEQHTRINAKVSETVVKGLAKVLKVMTGMAQHAGLYLRNGRKASPRGIHLLEITA